MTIRLAKSAAFTSQSASLRLADIVMFLLFRAVINVFQPEFTPLHPSRTVRGHYLIVLLARAFKMDHLTSNQSRFVRHNPLFAVYSKRRLIRSSVSQSRT
jgi:hypothetical protein